MLPIGNARVVLDRYIGQRLRQLRHNCCADPARVSEELGIKNETLSAYEQGRASIPARSLFDLACRFNVPISYFFDGYEPLASPALSLLPKGAPE